MACSPLESAVSLNVGVMDPVTRITYFLAPHPQIRIFKLEEPPGTLGFIQPFSSGFKHFRC